MNIFNKVTLQSMKKSRTRTIVTVIGVALSAAMITAVSTFAVSLLNYMIKGSVAKYGGWHVAFLDADSSFAQDRLHDKEVAGIATFENIGYAVLDTENSPEKPYLFLAGFSEEAFDILPITLISGRLPENDGEILVPSHVAAKSGVRFEVGDTLSLVVGRRMDGSRPLGQQAPYLSGGETGEGKERFEPQAESAYTVVGICERPGFEEHAAPGYTVITKAGSTKPANRLSVFIALANPRQAHAYASKTAGMGDYVFNDNVLRFIGASDDTVFNTFLYAVGGILTALIVIGSILLIYNSFTISLNERTRHFGILSSVGATGKQLRNSVLFEGLCIGAMGIPIGVLAGIGSIGILIPIVAANFETVAYSSVPLTLTVSVPAIAAAAMVSMVTILISAGIPARKASVTPVMESIRQSNEVAIQSDDVRTSKYGERIYGLEGVLALKNFKRNKRRYRSIILSLVLSVVLFVLASSFGTGLEQAAELSAVEIDGDILFHARGMEESELFRLYEGLKNVDGVTESTYQALSTYYCQVNTNDLTSAFWESYRESAGLDRESQTVELLMDMQFIDDTVYHDFMKGLGLPILEYTRQDGTMIVVGKQNGNRDIFANSSMDLTFGTQSGEQTRTIHTTFVDAYPLDPPPAEQSGVKGYVFMVVAPYSAKPQFETLGASVELGLTFWSDRPGQSTAKMQAVIEDTDISCGYTLYNVHGILEQNRNILFIVNLFTAVFVAMISLIAIANVFNTISTNMKLRRRELAMLRSVGMSDRDFNKMMCFECAFYGLRTLLFGLPLSVLFSWLIYRGIVAGGADIRFQLPWRSMGISMLGVFSAIFITMLYAVGRIKRENIIDVLRDDMT